MEMKCHVKDCKNHENEGLFIGIVCSPCYEFLSIGRGKTSQLYRNTIETEREACAKLVEEWGDPMGASLQIRARGQS